MRFIWVLAEHSECRLKRVTFELLTKAREVAQAIQGNVGAVLVGSGIEGLAPELQKWADKVYVVDNETLKDYTPDAYAKTVTTLFEIEKPIMFLIPASSTGRDLAPKLTARFDAAFASSCTDLVMDSGRLIAIRPVLGEKAFVRVGFKSPMQIMTIRPLIHALAHVMLLILNLRN